MCRVHSWTIWNLLTVTMRFGFQAHNAIRINETRCEGQTVQSNEGCSFRYLVESFYYRLDKNKIKGILCVAVNSCIRPEKLEQGSIEDLYRPIWQLI